MQSSKFRADDHRGLEFKMGALYKAGFFSNFFWKENVEEKDGCWRKERQGQQAKQSA